MKKTVVQAELFSAILKNVVSRHWEGRLGSLEHVRTVRGKFLEGGGAACSPNRELGQLWEAKLQESISSPVPKD